jgi:hypothetical protein
MLQTPCTAPKTLPVKRLLLWFLFYWIVSAPAEAQQTTAIRRAALNVVFSTSHLRAASKNDARAAMRVWLETAGARNGFKLDCNVTLTDSLAELKKRVQEGLVHLLLLDTLEYFDLSEQSPLEPAFVGIGTGTADMQLTLVTNRESGVSALRDLRGRSLYRTQ